MKKADYPKGMFDPKKDNGWEYNNGIAKTRIVNVSPVKSNPSKTKRVK